MAKGSQNERDKCREWSLWWSNGLDIKPPRDDIFWRSAGSGARARLRRNIGHTVHQGYGDMIAEDSIGQPLIDVCTFEFKKGYRDLSLLSCIDSKQKTPRLVSFLKQVEADAREKGNHPVLVFQRDYRDAVICITTVLYNLIVQWNEINTAKIRFTYPGLQHKFIMMRLIDFFHSVNPNFFIHYANNKTDYIVSDYD